MRIRKYETNVREVMKIMILRSNESSNFRKMKLIIMGK